MPRGHRRVLALQHNPTRRRNANRTAPVNLRTGVAGADVVQGEALRRDVRLPAECGKTASRAARTYAALELPSERLGLGIQFESDPCNEAVFCRLAREDRRLETP